MRKLFLFSLFLISFQFGFGQYLSGQAEMQMLYDRLEKDLPQTKEGLTQQEAEAVLTTVKNHPVASLKFVSDYDDALWPLSVGEIGYCFGRAMAAHMELRMAGVKRENLKKLFIAGDMLADDPSGISTTKVRWRFHVTTLVKDPVQNKWWTVDPVVNKPGEAAHAMSPAEWMKAARDMFDSKKTTKFYVANSDAIMVDMRVVPSAIEVENGERIIEVNFDPSTRKTTTKDGGTKKTVSDFEKATNDDGLGDITIPDLKDIVWKVNQTGQWKYFINRKDRAFFEAPEDPQNPESDLITKFNVSAGEDFDFFALHVTILRTKVVNGKNVPTYDFHRWYRYFTATSIRGEYFSALLRQTDEKARQRGLLE